MTIQKKTQDNIVKNRFKYCVEVAFVFFGIFLILFPISLIIDLVEKTSIFYGPLLFVSKALGLLVALPILLFLIQKILKWDTDIVKREHITASRSFLKLFRITKSNFKYQLLYGFLFLFLIFIPLDFLIYLIPGVIDYSIESLTFNKANAYLLYENYPFFLISVLIIQISVAFYEESIARGFLAKRGNDYFKRMSAVIISSFYFGLAHFAYILQPITFQYSILFPIIWFLQTFFVGIVLALFTLRKLWLFPVFFAHACNNIISAHTLWVWNQSYDFFTISLYIYFPLLFIGILLFIWQFSRIKKGIKSGLNEFQNYFKNDDSISEEGNDKFTRIIIDFLIGGIIFVMAYFLI
ncbi:MAG: CPBP family intramembrane metalloprotease [Promethearchaeota archaeon]|nr:MAG: CPBP family intramembrane metalloprotease [Candidatus Lokiarchaeota archaeon]